MVIDSCTAGVTPFASILKHIWYRQKKGTLGSLKRVEFFWVCRDAPSFGWFQTLLQEVEAAQETGRPERVLIGEAISIAEDKEHIHGAHLPEYDQAEALTAKEEGRK